MVRTQIQLSVDEFPKSWYNVLADLPEMPEWKVENSKQMGTYRRLLTKELVRQEFSKERYIQIPDEVRELLIHIGRPYSLMRAEKLEKYLKTPAKIYYKREDCSPTGAFKTNITIPACYYGAKEGYRRIAIATGAGQTGTAFAYASKMFKQKCAIYWVRYAYDLKVDRRALMKLYGAEVYASPSNQTRVGIEALKKWGPVHRGGTCLAEACEDTLKHDDTFSPIGSIYRHTIIYTSIIGLETKRQLELVDEKPDVIIGSVGGGSNFAGIISPFVEDVLKNKLECRFLAVETESSPKLTKGEYRYEYYDRPLKAIPMVKTYTVGIDYPSPEIYAEGLRWYTVSEIIGYMRHIGLVDAVAYPSDEKLVFDGMKLFVQTEGFLPAPESGYAIRAGIDEALEAKEKNEEKIIVVNISGHGFMDMEGYTKKLKLT